MITQEMKDKAWVIAALRRHDVFIEEDKTACTVDLFYKDKTHTVEGLTDQTFEFLRWLLEAVKVDD